MSYPVMPLLPISMQKGLKKSPFFNVSKQKTQANVGNSSVSYTPYASWSFEFDMDKILGNEADATSVMAQFQGTFMASQGSGGLWLFTDPQDNAVTQANSGMLDVTPGSTTPMASTGNGVSTAFQLARSIGGLAWDLIQNLNGTPNIYVNGVQTYAFSISSKGVVTFNPSLEVPGSGAALTWTGQFYFLCRFDDDTIDATRCFTTNSGTDQWDFSSVHFNSEFV